MDNRLRWMGFDMGSKELTESMAIMVVGAPAVYCACCRIKEGKQITDTIALILEVFENRLIAPHWQVWGKTF